MLFLEVDSDISFFQLSDTGQTVNCISGKSANGFCQNQVDISIFLQASFHHGIEVIPFLHICSGDTIICIYPCQIPTGVFCNQFCEVCHLCLIAGFLVFLCCTDSAVGGNIDFFYFLFLFCIHISFGRNYFDFSISRCAIHNILPFFLCCIFLPYSSHRFMAAFLLHSLRFSV